MSRFILRNKFVLPCDDAVAASEESASEGIVCHAVHVRVRVFGPVVYFDCLETFVIS